MGGRPLRTVCRESHHYLPGEQDQLPAHPSAVSQRLSLPGNFPARLCKPLRKAGGLKFKELLWTQESELASANAGPCSQTLLVEARKPPRGPLFDTNQAG